MDREALLTIITPTFNCREDLGYTLASIREQNWKGFEWIIVDGGSFDGTLAVVHVNADLVTHWVSEPDRGIYDAMNKGMTLAHGRYVQFLNAGDVFFSENSLDRVASVLNDSKPDALFGRFHVTDAKYQKIFDLTPRHFTLENLRHYGTATVNHQAMFIRRSIAPKYSLRYRLKGELNWYIDIVEQNPRLKSHYVSFPIIKYRVGGAGNVAYQRNLLEWISVVQRRFGTIQNLRNINRYRAFLRYIAYVKQFYA